MPTFIPRPDFVGDAVARLLTDQSEQAALKHNEEVAARKKRQRTTATVGTAVVGGIAGLALAPAGVASAAGGFGVAAGTSLTAAGVPALAGQIAGTLSGVQIGSRIGGQLADEDFAGAIGTGTQAVQGFLQNRENERFFGGSTTPEGRAASGRIVERLGTTLDALRRGGGTFEPGLAGARDAASQRTFEAGVGQRLQQPAADAVINSERDQANVGARANAERARIDDLINAMPGRERPVDHKAVTAAETDLGPVDQDAIDYQRSGGTDGAPLGETLPFHDIGGRLRRAATNGATVKTPPPTTIFRPDGTSFEIPNGSGAVFGGKLLIPDGTNDDGTPNFKTAEYTEPRPGADLPPGPERDKAVRDDFKSKTYVNPETGDTWVISDGDWKIDKGAVNEKESRRELIEGLAIDKDGFPRTRDQIANILQATEGVEQLLADRSELAQDVITFAENMGEQQITAAAFDSIAQKVNELFGDNPPRRVRNALDAIDARVQLDAVKTEAARQVIDDQSTPPPGSAAAAEGAGRSAARAVKAIPGAVASVPVAAQEAIGKVAKPIGQAAVGFLNELVGVKAKGTPEEEFEKNFAELQQRNLEAGPDDAVFAIMENGLVINIARKKDVTAEFIKIQKALGRTLPGLEGG